MSLLASLRQAAAQRIIPRPQNGEAGRNRSAKRVVGIELVANACAQVINQRGLPIPGLYAAGNNAVHTEYGVGYQAGFSLGSGMTFGYLAARHMAGMN